MHGRRIAECDAAGEVPAFEHGAGAVGEAFGGNAVGVGVDRGDAPPVAVTYLVDLVAARVWRGPHVNSDVVASAHDDVTDADRLISRDGDGRSVRRERVVHAAVECVGDLPGITDQQRVLTGGPVGEVGVDCVGGHGDRITGV